MTKNYQGFFGWQGNHSEFQTWFKWIALAMIFVILIALWIFREKIAKRYDRGGKFLWFKSDISMWRFIGILGLIGSTARLIVFVVQGYPLYWENIAIHLCRFHLWIIFFCMAFGKIKYIKYIAYVAIVGALFGMFFMNESSSFINDGSFKPGATAGTYEFFDAAGKTYKPTNLEMLMFNDKDFNAFQRFDASAPAAFYNVGFDNFWSYETLIAHWSLVFFPIFIRSAYRQKFDNVELFRTIIGYIVLTFVIWCINWGMAQIPDQHWQANYWYIGPDSVNDYKDALGVLSAWPCNLFTYTFVGFACVWLFHFIWFGAAKFKFFQDGKFIQVQKSQPWIEFKTGFYKGWFKDVFRRRERA